LHHPVHIYESHSQQDCATAMRCPDIFFYVLLILQAKICFILITQLFWNCLQSYLCCCCILRLAPQPAPLFTNSLQSGRLWAQSTEVAQWKLQTYNVQLTANCHNTGNHSWI